MKTKIEVKCTFNKRIKEWFAVCYYTLNGEMISGSYWSTDRDYAMKEAVRDLQEKVRFAKEHPTKIIEVDLDI